MSSPAFFTDVTPAPETTAIARDDNCAEAVRFEHHAYRASIVSFVDGLGSRSERERRRIELRVGITTS